MSESQFSLIVTSGPSTHSRKVEVCFGPVKYAFMFIKLIHEDQTKMLARIKRDRRTYFESDSDIVNAETPI